MRPGSHTRVNGEGLHNIHADKILRGAGSNVEFNNVADHDQLFLLGKSTFGNFDDMANVNDPLHGFSMAVGAV
eukprot:CAMPEP_0168628226 /NCGR_PEP_ID=MMETSP0449_2-20121227/11729_1 /TAXON_ID=1082188 /ORGANISM="Strombidium rassoulzadegani, Strain ras09" /LENGTH=72 /DNA_ID=CAMNT_0008670627 /DNA_START=145 /DNA_END=363 /DNA_ORIENTATION=-